MPEAKCIRIDSYNFGAVVDASIEFGTGEREVLLSTTGFWEIPFLKQVFGDLNPNIPVVFTDHALKMLAVKAKSDSQRHSSQENFEVI